MHEDFLTLRKIPWLTGSNPVKPPQTDRASGQRFARPNHNSRSSRIKLYNKKRLASYGASKTKSTSLTDCIMDNARMVSEQAAVKIYYVPGPGSAGCQTFDKFTIIASWNEANILTVGFFGDRKPKPPSETTNVHFIHLAKWKPQKLELGLGCGEEEVTLISGKVMCPIEGALACGIKG